MITYTYDANSNLLETHLPNGVTSEYTYDILKRLTELTRASVTETLSSFKYAYDDVGNRTTVT